MNECDTCKWLARIVIKHEWLCHLEEMEGAAALDRQVSAEHPVASPGRGRADRSLEARTEQCTIRTKGRVCGKAHTLWDD